MSRILKKLLKNAHKQLKKKSYDFKRLEVKAKLKSPVYLNDDIYLDGLIQHEQLRYYLGPDFYNLTKKDSEKLNLNLDLPILQSRGVFLASRGYYDDTCTFTAFFRKRFDTVRATKWIKTPKGKIRLSMGKFKQINMPMRLVSAKEIKWIVAGDKEEIQRLVNRIPSIGKKKAQGYGLVDRWEIKETKEKGERIFPVISKKQKGDRVSRYRPSYFLQSGKMLCYIGEF